MTSSSGKSDDMAPMKQEDESNRIMMAEEEIKSLKDDVTKFLSVASSQSYQLARQERMLGDMMDERNRKAKSKMTICWIMLIVVAVLLMAVSMGYASIMPGDDTILYLNVKATPVKAPFITAAVKVRFTMGDVISCAKGAFAGDTLDLSLS